MARKLILLVLAFGMCTFYGMAQSKDYFRIARLSYLEGHVSFQHTDEVEWTAASINMALQPADRIYTGENGRAEIEFDDGSVVRLAEKTDVEILTMREELIQLRVLIGLCSLTERSTVQFEIDTPAAAFTTTDKGSYRFDIAENGDSDGIVRKGAMEAANNRFSKHVSSGEFLHVPAAENGVEVLARYDQRDAWDEWNDRRNAAETASESRNYIADGVYMGASDLDMYGRWGSINGYGAAWIPQVGAGWAPYWDGRWCYRPNWGWTWVSYEPWGWLPYHYGRWIDDPSFGWAWLPGPSFGFHFWSPGLVQFYQGANWVSWLPLGPGDYYNVNNYYFNGFNRANLYYLNEMRLMQRRGPDDLINRHNPTAFLSVRTDQFVNGSPGGRIDRVTGIDPRQGGRIVTGALDVRPTARSFSPAPDRLAERPSIKTRPVVVRTDPEFRARGDKFVAITNPAIAVSRARTDQQGRDLRANPNSGNRIQQDNGAPARTYQVPQSRSTPTMQQGRTVQPMPQRQDSVPRMQQAPAGEVHRMDSPPPQARTMDSSAGRMQQSAPPSSGSSGSMARPSYSPSMGSSAPMRSPNVSGPTMSAPAAGRSAPPSAAPAASAPPASAPVKKVS
ncbi:MAG: FecR family protein [Acidobacteriota bacterium]